MFVVCFRFLVTMNVHYGDYKDFNDLALPLTFNYNKYKPAWDPGKDTKLQYKDTVCILVIFSYNWAVQYMCRGGIHKGHHQALAMSFLEITRFFGRQFHDEKMTNKWHHQFDDALAAKNGADKKDGMTELLTWRKGSSGSSLWTPTSCYSCVMTSIISRDPS